MEADFSNPSHTCLRYGVLSIRILEGFISVGSELLTGISSECPSERRRGFTESDAATVPQTGNASEFEMIWENADQSFRIAAAFSSLGPVDKSDGLS